MNLLQKKLTPIILFGIFFLAVPISQLGLDPHLLIKMIPGDIVDARLNNYFLENIFQFMQGQSESLWDLGFFWPFPYVLGFSENLFGSAPVYIVGRLFGGESDTAYQIWFLFGYVFNYSAVYYALRRLNTSVLASSVGALIFAFALPTSAHANHAQLHYRFGLPLSIVFFVAFLNSKAWRNLIISGAWLVWQFYAGVYIGFFSLFLLGSMCLAYLGHALIIDRSSLINIYKEFCYSWCDEKRNKKYIYLSLLIVLLVLLCLLFYPYLQVSYLYGAKRSWGEISSMLPRPQSYFLSDASFLWSSTGAKIFSDIPMRHEHQMFFGILPLTLALTGFIIGSRAKNGPNFTLISGMLGIAIVLTLYVGGLSLWYLLHKLPLFSAIRAMSRLDQAFLFPIAYLSVITIDSLRARYLWGTKAVLILILPLLIAEASMTTMGTSSKDSWRQRFTSLNAVVPKDLPDNSILFFAQRSDPPYASELDAMLVSLHHKMKTLNGYSGLYPPGYDYEFDSDCAKVPKRVLYYLKFTQQSENIIAYRELMSRIVPVGFNGCNPEWFHTPPQITSSDKIYTPEEFRQLHWGGSTIVNTENSKNINIEIINSSNNFFSANSQLDKPIRLSWRFNDAAGQPLSGWDTRKNLPFDIPANGKINITIPLDISKNKIKAKSVSISLVQELVFWAHDIGVAPITIPLE
jgi:hypothetical protein